MASRPLDTDTAFDAAFAAAASDNTEFGMGDPAPPADAAPVETPADDAPQGDPNQPVDEGAAAPAADTGTDGDGSSDGDPAAPAAPDAAASATDIVKELADLLKQQPQAPAPAPAAEVPAAPQQDIPLYNQDEIGVLQEYEKNWPDVAAAESLKRRAEYHDLMKFVFSEVHNFVAPIAAQVRAMGNTLHLGELRQAVPDYSENLEAEVAAWVDSQPSYLQAGMKQVMQTGTSEEVADLIGRYRAATGTAPAQAQPAPTPVPAPARAPKTELSSAAKQAAESLAPVSGDRSQVPVGEDPKDFDSAFARYAADSMGT